jgi:hypothetical protein
MGFVRRPLGHKEYDIAMVVQLAGERVDHWILAGIVSSHPFGIPAEVAMLMARSLLFLFYDESFVDIG